MIASLNPLSLSKPADCGFQSRPSIRCELPKAPPGASWIARLSQTGALTASRRLVISSTAVSGSLWLSTLQIPPFQLTASLRVNLKNAA